MHCFRMYSIFLGENLMTPYVTIEKGQAVSGGIIHLCVVDLSGCEARTACCYYKCKPCKSQVERDS